jgi:PleD family two-component response regulator
MRRLELDLATENSGFDERTGLRSLKLMKDDIAREMERRARRGNPLSLALVKINNYRPEWKKEEKPYRDVITKIADQVKECLRSFDDAYYLGDEYYLLSFKHADLVGSQAAMTRLNRAITQAHIPTPGDPMEGVSVSSVLCEPTPGDSIDQLLVNMKKDLMNVDEKGVVLQYNEMSPIQRYMLSMEKGK